MNDLNNQLSPSQRFFVLLSVAGTIFGIKYLILMNGGALYGRLSHPPIYDDVTYFVDALRRLRLFQQSGLWAVLTGLFTNPPHSPYATIGAFLAYLIAGESSAAPYAVNAFAAALILATIATAFRWPIGFAAVFFAFMTSLPWFDYLVAVFHPDLVSGLALAATAIILLWQDELITSPRRAALAGTAIAFALLAKPTVLPLAVAMIGLSFVLGITIARWQQGSWNGVIRRTVVGLVVVLIVAAPFYAITIVGIIGYIKGGIIGQHDVWAFRGNFLDQLEYFPQRSVEMLRFLPVVALVLLVAGLVLEVGKRRGPEALRYAGLLALTFLAYLAPTIPDMKTYLFGATFYAMFVLIVGIIAAKVYGAAPRWLPPAFRPALPAVTLGLLIVSAIVQFSDAQERFPAIERLQTTAVYNRVFTVAKAYSQALTLAGKPRAVELYTPSPVPVVTHAYIYRGLREGTDIDAYYSIYENNLSTLYETAARSDIVVVIDQAIVAETFSRFPVNQLLPAFRKWIAESPRFRKADEINWGKGLVLIYEATSN